MIGAVGTFGIRLANALLVLFNSMLLARILGVTGYGAYAYAVSWAALLSVAALLGLDVLVTREVSQYKAKSDWALLAGIERWSLWVSFLFALLLCLIGAVVAWRFRDRLSADTLGCLLVALTVLPIFTAMRLKQAVLWGLGKVVEAQLPQWLGVPSVFLLSIAVFYYALGLSSPVSAVGLRVLAIALAFVLAAVLLARRRRSEVKRARPRYRRREWLQGALPLLFVAFAVIINDQVSVVMLGSIVGPEPAGLYDVVRRGSGLVAFALAAVNMPLAPLFARLHARCDKKGLQSATTMGARLALFGSLCIGGALVLFSRPFLLLFGEAFIAGRMALFVLIIAQAINAGMGSVGYLLNMTGHEWVAARGVGLAAILNVALNAGLIPVWGVEGAAVASATSLVVWNALLSFQAYKRLGICTTVFGRISLKGK
jgi:O-antigen/teichoic acid export membrane protein